MREEEFLQIYMDEIKEIPVCTPEELAALPLEAQAGSEAAKARLAEGLLMETAKISLSFAGKGVPQMDLIQEGSIGLLMAIAEYEGGDFKALYEKKVREMMAALVDEESHEGMAQEKMLGYINELNEVTVSLAEDFGREATLTEIADRMHLTEDEVRDIMKFAVDAMQS